MHTYFTNGIFLVCGPKKRRVRNKKRGPVFLDSFKSTVAFRRARRYPPSHFLLGILNHLKKHIPQCVLAPHRPHIPQTRNVHFFSGTHRQGRWDASGSKKSPLYSMSSLARPVCPYEDRRKVDSCYDGAYAPSIMQKTGQDLFVFPGKEIQLICLSNLSMLHKG